MSSKASPWRRIAAVAVLMGGIGLAWRAASEANRDVQVTFLLNRAEFRSGDAVIDRSRLVRFDWRVPTAAGASGTLQAGTLHWQAGNAPEATEPIAIELPAQIHHLEVRCTFALAGSATARTRGLVAVDGASEAITLSVEECGNAEP